MRTYAFVACTNTRGESHTSSRVKQTKLMVLYSLKEHAVGDTIANNAKQVDNPITL